MIEPTQFGFSCNMNVPDALDNDKRAVDQSQSDLKTLFAKNGAQWRNWLGQNHLLEHEVWLVFYRNATGKASLSYDEAIDEALCFGWIDSAIRKIDDAKYARKFTPRRPGSTWSKLNIERIERLTKRGKMTEYGLTPFRARSAELGSLRKSRSKNRRYKE